MRVRDVIVASRVVHAYPTFALGPADLAVPAGTVHGLLGPNGNGKTTLINLLVGLLVPHEGSVTVLGDAPKGDGAAIYRDVGFAPDEDDLVDELTALEYWDLCAAVLAEQGADRARMLANARAVARRLSFTPPNQQAAAYSHGMRRKTQLVAALLHEPALIVLDEPTNGLDPISAFSLGEVLREHAARGAAVLVATHDLAWAERFTDVASLVTDGCVSTPRRTADVLRPSADVSLLDGFVAATQAMRIRDGDAL